MNIFSRNDSCKSDHFSFIELEYWVLIFKKYPAFPKVSEKQYYFLELSIQKYEQTTSHVIQRYNYTSK